MFDHKQTIDDGPVYTLLSLATSPRDKGLCQASKENLTKLA